MASSAAVFILPMPSTMIGCDLGQCGVTILSDDRTISDVDAFLSLFYCLLSLSFAYVWLLFTPSKFCLIQRRAKASKHFSCRLRTVGRTGRRKGDAGCERAQNVIRDRKSALQWLPVRCLPFFVSSSVFLYFSVLRLYSYSE